MVAPEAAILADLSPKMGEEVERRWSGARVYLTCCCGFGFPVASPNKGADVNRMETEVMQHTCIVGLQQGKRLLREMQVIYS